MKTKFAILLVLAFAATTISAAPMVFGVGVGYPYYGYAATYPYGYYALPCLRR